MSEIEYEDYCARKTPELRAHVRDTLKDLLPPDELTDARIDEAIDQWLEMRGLWFSPEKKARRKQEGKYPTPPPWESLP